MPIATISGVRYFMGNRGPSIIDDATITDKISWSDAYVKVRTGGTTWISGVEGYEIAREISELLASSSLLKGFSDEQEESHEQWKRASEMLDQLIQSIPAVESETVDMISPEYDTFPLNPVGYYRDGVTGRLIKQTGSGEFMEKRYPYYG